MNPDGDVRCCSTVAGTPKIAQRSVSRHDSYSNIKHDTTVWTHEQNRKRLIHKRIDTSVELSLRWRPWCGAIYMMDTAPAAHYSCYYFDFLIT